MPYLLYNFKLVCKKIIKDGHKMRDITEIRWHGRGGQGAKTAALLLADAAFKNGKHVQAFPEYGPEREGAQAPSPMTFTSFFRLSMHWKAP